MKAFFKPVGVAVSVFSLLLLGACSGSSDIEEPAADTNTETVAEEEEVVDDTPITVSAERMDAGKAIYDKSCTACHQPTGDGIQNAFPPLAKSDYLNEDVDRAIQIVLEGKTGPITVNGAEYNSVMAAVDLPDQDVADVLTFVYNSWGNNRTEVSAGMVAAVREGL